MLAAVRFLWNSTRGHRLTPWRSEYFKWRVETYSGMKAETLDFAKSPGLYGSKNGSSCASLIGSIN